MHTKYKTKFTEKELQDALNAGKSKARILIENKDKWEGFKKKLNVFLEKGRHIPVLGSVIDDIITMAEMADAYIHKKYLNIPFGSILSVIAALIYVLSPIDLIPDVLPVIGYVDDVAVVMLVLHLGVDQDLDRFRKWKKEILQDRTALFQRTFATELSALIGSRFLSAALLTDDGKLKLLLCEDENVCGEVECVVRETAVPSEALRQLGVNTESDILEVLGKSVASETVRWIKGAEKRIFSEPDFEGKWDDYIILED